MDNHRITMTNQYVNETIKEYIARQDGYLKFIRSVIKARAPNVSVRKGTGTAATWIDVWSKGTYFTEEENKALKELGFIPGGNCVGISPENREYVAKHLEEVISRGLK